MFLLVTCNSVVFFYLLFLVLPDLYLTSILQEVDRVPATVYGSKTATTNEQMECLQHALTCKLSKYISPETSGGLQHNGLVYNNIVPFPESDILDSHKIIMFHYYYQCT